MRPVVVKVGPLAAASATAVASVQPGAAGVPLALNGALAAPQTAYVFGTGMVTSQVATLDAPRRIGLASSGNDTGITFAVAGTDRAGQAISETVAGSNAGTASTALDYAAVTSVVPSGATAGTVSVGTTTVASSAWVRLDDDVAGPSSIQIVPSGTVTAKVEQTLDDPNSVTNPVAPASVSWSLHPAPEAQAISGAGGPMQTSYAENPIFARVTLTAGSGSVTATFAQAGRQSPS